jgi:predicted phage tail protein
VSEIIGSKGGEKEHVHYEAPDSLHSTSYARVLDLVSEGEILGLTAGLESIYLNDTPVQNADGTKNFKDVSIDFRTGTQTQDYIPGFPDVENEVAINVELKAATPWVRAINNLALSAIRITLGVPALSQQDTKNGDVKGYKVDYKIELAKDGGAYAAVLTSSFNGKTTTAYQRTARIDLPPATTGWQVRVTRLTANANTAAIADVTTIVSFTEVIDAKLRYPMSAIVGIQVDAKQFQSVPTRAYDLMGRIIQVPSNYNAKTRAYTGNWDGTFKPSWTDNPAWIFRDLALNDRYGLGHRITAAQLDKWSLYAIARYCDGLVPNGKGGMEPRFTCNLYLQTQKQAYAVLQDLASIFRGISYWGAGSIIASADMPTDPVYVYTAANVIGGKFSRVGSSKKTRFTTALVSWNDPADMYKAKVEYTEDPEGIVRYGIQQTSLTAFGCSSQGQAQRVGRWALATSRLETEMISFDVGMDGAIALPGQIIRVADPSRMGRRNGGRIKTASGRVVVLDKAPIINAGDKLTVILPTGTSETRVVASIAGDAVTVTADWTALPVAQSVWSVDSTVLIAPTYKVRSVTEKDAVTYTISATQHEPGKFDFIELGTAITPRPETALNAAVQQPPGPVTVTPYTVSLQDVQKLGFTASCAAVDGAIAYEGAFQADNGNWFTMPRQPGPVFDVLDVLAGYYTVKIAAVNALGITSIETISAPTLVSKNANPRNADILLSLSAPGFNVNIDSSITPASITIHATLLDLEGTVSWSAYGATITSSNNNATLVASNMPGAAATVTASIIALGQTFTRSIDIVKSADGAAGAANYTWIKYGTSAAGAGLTDNPAGMTYIGLAFNKSSPTESTVATDYAWSLIGGTNGADGASLFTGVVYLQQAAQPSTPTGGTFNFTTSTLTPPTGWSATQPTASTVPTWAVRFTFRAATIGATVTAGTWSAPVNVSQNGGQGAAAPQTMVIFLYQWNAAAPAAPQGTSTLNWATGKNSSYNGTDGWAVDAPVNPGTPGLRLYVATQSVTAPGGTTSTPGITYASAAISAWSQNGNNGANGAQSAEPTVYQWAATIPAGPSGTGTHTWSTGLFGAAPINWTLAPGAPVPGNTLWVAKVRLLDTAAATTTTFNWVNAAITAQSYAGTNGTSTPGTEGASYVAAYVATTVGTASTAPAATTGRTSLPAANSSGLTGTPQATVPTLAAGQYLMQFDGIYNPATNQVTWSIPYQASLKVGSLSAIATNTGKLIVTDDFSSANGKFLVDANGQMTASAATLKSADGTVMFTTGTGLTLAAAPAGTRNSELADSIAAAQNTANAARDASGIANNAIAVIASDYILDRSEKPRIITEFTAIDAERTGIAKSATDLGISAATYQGTINNLAAFLTNNVGSSTSDWSNVSIDSPFDGPYMRDRFVDVYRERQKLLDAVAAKLQANAAAAATTATAAGISGQMSVPQVAQFLPPGGVTNALFGGDLYSSDWNGYTDYRMRGWYLQRSGNFFGYNVVLRGAIMSANMPAVGTWLPAGGGNVMYFGPEGMQAGNFNDGRFVYIAANGDIQAPGLSLINKQLTLTNTILIAPRIGDNMSASISLSASGNYVTLNRNVVNAVVVQLTGTMNGPGSGNYAYLWDVSTSNPYVSCSMANARAQVAQFLVTGKGQTGEIDFYVGVTITDQSSGITKTAFVTITVNFT